MSSIQHITNQHPDAGNWHRQYPWFAIGHLVHAANEMNTSGFTASAQKAAAFFNHIPRLHWLLHPPDSSIEETGTVPGIPVIQEGLLHTPGSVQPDALAFDTGTEQQTTAGRPEQPASGGAPVIPSQDTEHHLSINLSELPEEPEMPEEETTEENAQEVSTGLLSQSLAQAAGSFKNDVIDEDALVFKTAYQHTIDYFASQGINLDQEPAHDDQFGQQLKTFTSWLRQMKRLPDAAVAVADPVVESHAAHSLQKDDVLTESMADVLLKQGKKDQAIIVIEKLRLLHPQKSHYFAARIEQIKHS